MLSNSYKRILVPIDGSKATPKVMETAIQVARLNDAHLDILNVAQVNQLADGYADILALSEDQTFDLVQLVTARLRDLKEEALQAGVKSVIFTSALVIPSKSLPKTSPWITSPI